MTSVYGGKFMRTKKKSTTPLTLEESLQMPFVGTCVADLRFV